MEHRAEEDSRGNQTSGQEGVWDIEAGIGAVCGMCCVSSEAKEIHRARRIGLIG
jgi:hypothetical protein